MLKKIQNYIKKLLKTFYVWHLNMEKNCKIYFGKDLKCGNIFMNLEEPPKESNKITLDKKIIDKNGVPITNLYYKNLKRH